MSESINERIAIYRKLRRKNQTEIAEQLGLKISTYSQRERIGNITCEFLIDLARILDVDIRILLYGEEYCKEHFGDKTYQPPKELSLIDELKNKTGIYVVELNAREKDLITALRNLKPEARNEIFITTFLALEKNIHPNKKR